MNELVSVAVSGSPLRQRLIDDMNMIVAQAKARPGHRKRRIKRGDVTRLGQDANAGHAGVSRSQGKMIPLTKCAAIAPISCAATKAGTQAGAIPAKLLLNDRARVMAGLAKLVDEVNQ